jgi:hypothetical protein
VNQGSLSDWVIVAFTLVLTVVAWLQYQLERQLAKENANNLDLARRSAEAASASAEIARQNLHLSMRAYVTFKRFQDIFLFNQTDAGEQVIFQLTPLFENVGGTPATNCRVRTSAEVRPAGDAPLVFDFDLPADQQGMTIGPRLELSAATIRFALEDLDRAYKGELRLFVTSRLEYTDVFNIPHHTQVCSEVLVWGDMIAGVRENPIPKLIAYASREPFNTGD